MLILFQYVEYYHQKHPWPITLRVPGSRIHFQRDSSGLWWLPCLFVFAVRIPHGNSGRGLLGGGCISVVGGFEEQVRWTRFMAQVHWSSSRAGAGTVTSPVPPGRLQFCGCMYVHTRQKRKHKIASSAFDLQIWFASCLLSLCELPHRPGTELLLLSSLF